MKQISQKRQLAAIMFTDIVGYTALMGEDEEKALHTRRINREIHQQQIETVGGTWLKEMGDGTMASFATITDAVQAAIEIRRICKQELNIELKVGIHLGEIIHEDDDVFGDGINIASRIESLAAGGGILISEAVFKNIRNREDYKAVFVGETSLKNIEGQHKLYQLLDGDLLKPTIKIRSKGRSKLLAIASAIILALIAVGYFVIWPTVFDQPIIKKSIAILPFKNLSKDNENEVFIAGVMSDINSLLARMKEIDLLIGEQSVEKYRETNLTIKEIASELGVNYLLTGNGRKAGNNVRVSVNLINAKTGKSIWSNDYNKPLLDIFSVQNDIAKEVAANLKISLSDIEKQDIEDIPTQNKAAYEAFLKGREYSHNFSVKKNKVDNDLAEQFYKKSIALDSNFALPYFAVAGNYYLKAARSNEGYNWFDSMTVMIDKGLELQPRAEVAYHLKYLYQWWKARLKQTPENIAKAREALNMFDEIAPNHPAKYRTLANFYDLIQQHDSAVYYVLKHVQRNPNNPNGLMFAGSHYETLGQPQQAELYYLEALKKQPDYVPAIQGLWNLYQTNGDYAEALKRAKYLKKINNFLGSYLLGYTYLLMGELNNAEIAFNEARKQRPEFNRLKMYYGFVLWLKGDKKKGKKILDEVAAYYNAHLDSEADSKIDLARINSALGNKDLAIQYLDEAFKIGYVDFKSILTNPFYSNIRDDARVQLLINMQKQKLQKMQDNLAMMETTDELKELRKR